MAAQKKGFASMSGGQQKSVASKGGHSSHGSKKSTSKRSGSGLRGFAAMDPAKQREIASKGGQSSHGGGRPKGS